MGTTLNLLQIDGGPARHDTIADMVRSFLSSLPEQPHYPWRQDVIIASDPDCRWITVLANPLIGQLDALAVQVGRALNAGVIAINLFDSDVLAMTLFHEGTAVDTFSDWANYEHTPKRRTGDAGKWHAVLPDGITPDALAQAWKSQRDDYPFQSEGILERVADLLGMDPDVLWWDGCDNSPAARITVLPLTVEPAESKLPGPYTQIASGPPVFVPWGATSRQDWYAGQPQRLFLSVLNQGGAGLGVVISASGGDLVQFSALSISPPFAYRGAAAPESPSAGVWRWPDYAFEPGFRDWDVIQALPPDRRDILRELPAQHTFLLDCLPQRAGETRIEVTIAPRENPQAGAAVIRVDVTIREAK